MAEQAQEALRWAEQVRDLLRALNDTDPDGFPELHEVVMTLTALAQRLLDLAQQLEQAEQRIEELERALERIANKDHDKRNPWHEALMIARIALSREDSDEG